MEAANAIRKCGSPGLSVPVKRFWSPGPQSCSTANGSSMLTSFTRTATTEFFTHCGKTFLLTSILQISPVQIFALLGFDPIVPLPSPPAHHVISSKTSHWMLLSCSPFTQPRRLCHRSSSTNLFPSIRETRRWKREGSAAVVLGHPPSFPYKLQRGNLGTVFESSSFNSFVKIPFYDTEIDVPSGFCSILKAYYGSRWMYLERRQGWESRPVNSTRYSPKQLCDRGSR